MFKKFVDFFFEDVEESVEVEEEVIEPTPQETVVRKPMADISLAPKKAEEGPVASAPSQMEFYDVAEKPSRFIDLEEVKKEIRPARKEHRVEIKDMRKTEYEFNAVISPIFGVREGSTTPPQDSSKASKSEEESILGTVFSPMYGRNANHVEEKENSEADVALQKEEALPPMFELDEILATAKPSHEEEAHQFSIFDDFQTDSNQDSHLDSDLSEFFDPDNK